MDNAFREDAVLIPQLFGQRSGLLALDSQQPDAAALARVGAGGSGDARRAREALGPQPTQIAQTRGLTLHADFVMKLESIGNCIVVGCRMIADFLELAAVGGHF